MHLKHDGETASEQAPGGNEQGQPQQAGAPGGGAPGGDQQEIRGSIPAVEGGEGEGEEEGGGCCDNPGHCDHNGGGMMRVVPHFDLTSGGSGGGLGALDGGKADNNVNPWGVMNNLSHSAPNTHSPGPGAFGAEVYRPKFENIDYFIAASGNCAITGKLQIDTPWGVKGGDNIDISGPTSGVITAENYTEIYEDLKPTEGGKPKRDKYWSQALTQRHEMFHGTDDWQWTQNQGYNIVGDWMATQRVRSPFTVFGLTVSDGDVKDDIQTLLKDAIKKLKSENMKYYSGGGAAHGDRPGEIRAYADGKASYQALADGVKAHGESLAAAAPGGAPGAPGGAPAPAPGGAPDTN
jgi:hypothetical protein